MSDAADQDSAKPKRARRGSSSSGQSDEEGGAAASEEAHEPQPCMPCHGSGKVISNLGGHARKVTCPWCRGGGVRLTGVDAQEFQQEQAAKGLSH
jgi:DnaJ-class molecular chaperone